MESVAQALEGLREDERRLSAELTGVRRAIAALEKVMGIEPAAAAAETTAPLPSPAPPSPPPEPGPYAECDGVYNAAAEYLASVGGEPKTAREIAEALRAGGFPTRASDFTASVRTMLHRDLSARDYGICPTENGNRWFFRP